MAEERKVARLDLGGFKPKTAPAADPAQDRAAVAVGKQLGFSGRAEAEKIDGRTLRRKGKAQMNMRVSLGVQNDFKRVVTEFPDTDACLAHLLDLYHRSKAS
jgi:hypothetical protein